MNYVLQGVGSELSERGHLMSRGWGSLVDLKPEGCQGDDGIYTSDVICSITPSIIYRENKETT